MGDELDGELRNRAIGRRIMKPSELKPADGRHDRRLEICAHLDQAYRDFHFLDVHVDECIIQTRGKRMIPANPKWLYFGNLFPHEHQYRSGLFYGLTLKSRFDRDIEHDARNPLPFDNDSILGFQSQDVFEHINREDIPAILNEVYRCLAPSGIFRLSVPDYNSPLLTKRTVYDENGNPLYDMSMGGKLRISEKGSVEAEFENNGEPHVWFPTYDQVLDLIIRSDIRRCSSIKFYHYWVNRKSCVCIPFDQSVMPVGRCPPGDMRAQGKPISIIVDFIK